MCQNDLPLALIMEEILGWEKKESDRDKEKEDSSIEEHVD